MLHHIFIFIQQALCILLSEFFHSSEIFHEGIDSLGLSCTDAMGKPTGATLLVRRGVELRQVLEEVEG